MAEKVSGAAAGRVPGNAKPSVLVLGAGGFIGCHLTKRLLEDDRTRVTAVDLYSEKLDRMAGAAKADFVRLDITTEAEKLEALVREHDTVIDLIAVANPSVYVSDPISVFQLNFVENLKVVELCVKYNKRIIQFSTCEVYGVTVASVLGQDPLSRLDPFNEDTTPLIMGPICNHRWIYASAKQLLERVLHAHGLQNKLDYTIIRPFNFVGPEIDYLPSEQAGNPRVFSHFMNALLYGTEMKLVDGGSNLRGYTYIDDAVECMVRVVYDQDNSCQTNREIINIGNPDNEPDAAQLSIKELAHMMLDLFDKHFRTPEDPPSVRIVDVPAEEFYGKGYEDCDRRIADVSKAKRLLKWEPKLNMEETVMRTMEYFVHAHRAKMAAK